jgi:hypothetical protein
MKRILLAAALLLGGAIGAQADNNVWSDTTRRARGDDALHADVAVCEQRVGPDLNGRPTSRQFKKCMSGRGWRLDHTTRERVTREHTWIDPDTGLTCHSEGIASVCSNF